MPERLDDVIRTELASLAQPGDPTGVADRILERPTMSRARRQAPILVAAMAALVAVMAVAVVVAQRDVGEVVDPTGIADGEAALRKGSARVSMTHEVQTRVGRQQATMHTQVDGVVDFSLDRWALTEQGRPTGRGRRHFGLEPYGPCEAVIDGPSIYYRVAEDRRQDVGGKSWVRIDDMQLPSVWGPSTVGEQIAAAGRVTRIGEDVVRGVRVTGYRTLIPVEFAVAAVAEEQGDVARARYRQFGIDMFEVELWIDANGLLRRHVQRVEGASVGGPERTIRGESIQEYYDFGVGADIELPSSEDVTEWSGYVRVPCGPADRASPTDLTVRTLLMRLAVAHAQRGIVISEAFGDVTFGVTLVDDGESSGPEVVSALVVSEEELRLAAMGPSGTCYGLRYAGGTERYASREGGPCRASAFALEEYGRSWN